MAEEPEFRSKGIPPQADGMSAAKPVFPKTAEEFENDPRVARDHMTAKWVLKENNGSEWEYDERLSRWVPSLAEELLEKQRQVYMAESDRTTPDAQKKRKQDDDDSGENNNDVQQKKARKAKPEKPVKERKNRAVWVSSLPLDATKEELNAVFSKYGIIDTAINDEDDHRIKMYTDDKGQFNGQALIVYFRDESVQLACDMLDDSPFDGYRKGPEGNMRVAPADQSYKRHEDVKEDETQAKAPRVSKKLMQKKVDKLNSKLADWDDDEDTSTMTQTGTRHDKIVVLKHMFTLQELEEDENALEEITEDIREECSKVGTVVNVVVFDLEPVGAAIARFETAEAARAAARMMNGRSFDGRTVKAYISDGSERFKRSKLENEESNVESMADYLNRAEPKPASENTTF
ncbi:uncharacterized protein K452DRAFT_283803 [Aplosporella prunicola CBS 121167]|uniref:RRM domain-containing protein n=1 Tax=Aplosporella prunicola CBS 121167 TaxID=1176127 RepID=A0A6A6BQD5_9PEZI|nr:uncharacterized protein K452DRAFT_283803 [Aplosporella prunicola CBS 121167]KAF2145454.1 hypothetical protein K452DRAFT_283803 [Aplosporella prunicola CBS 121167]